MDAITRTQKFLELTEMRVPEPEIEAAIFDAINDKNRVRKKLKIKKIQKICSLKNLLIYSEVYNQMS